MIKKFELVSRARSGPTDSSATEPSQIWTTNDIREFADIWPRTERCETVHCYVFQCADVLEVWCHTVGKARGTLPLFVAILDEREHPLFLLPLGIERHRGLRILRFMDGEISDYNAPVIFKPMRSWQAETIKRIWQELVRVLPKFDIAILEKMPKDVDGVPNPFVYLGRPFSVYSAHSVTLVDDWRHYAATRLPRRGNSIYKRRKLKKLGNLAFKIAESPADRRRILEAVLSQKMVRQIKTIGVSVIDHPGFRQYFIRMTERFTWPGPLMIVSLELDGKIIAAGWHYVFKERFIFLIPSFNDEEWGRFSPGRLLLEDLIEWSFTNGVKVFDFTIGDENYKLEYADQKLPLYQANIPVSLLGRAYESGRGTRAWASLKKVWRAGHSS